MRLRQIAFVGEDLDALKGEITDILGLGADYADPGVGKYGLHNAVWPVGNTFLEVVSPRQPGTTAGRLLEKRGGDGGYMVILQTDDLQAARDRCAAEGVRVVDQFDGDGVHFTHLHPRDVGAAILSIDAMTPRDRWEWGGPDWTKNVKTDTSTAIVGAELQGEDPGALAVRWAGVLGHAAEPLADGEGWRIALEEGGELRFVPARDGRGEGLGGIDVAVRDPAAVQARAAGRGLFDGEHLTLCGVRVRLVAA